MFHQCNSTCQKLVNIHVILCSTGTVTYMRHIPTMPFFTSINTSQPRTWRVNPQSAWQCTMTQWHRWPDILEHDKAFVLSVVSLIILYRLIRMFELLALHCSILTLWDSMLIIILCINVLHVIINIEHNTQQVQIKEKGRHICWNFAYRLLCKIFPSAWWPQQLM